jgi:hypothetical protein
MFQFEHFRPCMAPMLSAALVEREQPHGAIQNGQFVSH